MMGATLEERRAALLARGVCMPAPDMVAVDADVDASRIAPGVVLHPGTRLGGARTSLGPGCIVGEETPATLQDCQLGHEVRLKGGFYAGSVFLDGSAVGSAAHVRPGTLLEEGAEAAHAVGLKQTLLLPFVVTGSLVNFCDLLMAGGTSRRDHSEVGSSYVHFNFTPHGDKATASLVGDVPRGVFLRERPIFLGGQGGLVGPRQVAYGSTVAAGTVLRKDIPEPGLLVSQGGGGDLRRAYQPGVYRRLRPLVSTCLNYLGQVQALRAWYELVRTPVMRMDPYRAHCLAGGQQVLRLVLRERVKRLGAVAAALPASVERGRQTGEISAAEAEAQSSFHTAWPGVQDALLQAEPAEAGDLEARDAFLKAWAEIPGATVIDRVQALPDASCETGRAWLQSIVESTRRVYAPVES